MRLILPLFLLVISYSNIFAQDNYSSLKTEDPQSNEPPTENFIRRLQKETKINLQLKNEMEAKVKATLILLEDARKNGKQNARMKKELQEKLNEAKESYYQLTNIYKAKNDSLGDAYLKISNLKNISKELKEDLEKYKSEINRLETEKAVSVNELQRDVELLGLMLSGFTVFEIGTFKSGKMEVHKKYDSSSFDTQNQKTSFKNPDLLTQKLDALNYSGTLCIPKNKSLGQHIPGKILIYANEKLIHSFPDKLTLKTDNNISNIQCYEICNRQKVNFDFPTKSNIRVGFVSEETLRHLNNDDLDNFWETEEKGYFIISSLKSSYKLLTFSDSLLVKNAVITDSVFIKGSELYIDIYDNGYVDGDIASFYVNGVLEIDKLSLKSTAERRRLILKDDINILTLVANSTGEAAPCTARIVIYEGKDQRGAITLSGTENKSHSLKLIRLNSKAAQNTKR